MFPQINKRRFGKNLKQIMKLHGTTPRQIQEYLSLSCVQTVYRWMEGINIPCVDHLYALSVLLGVDMEQLIGNLQKSDCEEAVLFLNEKDFFMEKKGRLSAVRLGIYQGRIQECIL